MLFAALIGGAGAGTFASVHGGCSAAFVSMPPAVYVLPDPLARRVGLLTFLVSPSLLHSVGDGPLQPPSCSVLGAEEKLSQEVGEVSVS